jgi:hypothetical protein
MTIDQKLEGEVDFGTSGLLGRSSTIDEESLRPAASGPVAGDYEVQELWYRLAARPWSSLAVVSPDRTPNTLRLARSLAELGTLHTRHVVDLIDGLQLDPDRAAAIAQRVGSQGSGPSVAEPRFVIAVDSPIVNPVAIRLLATADAVLMLLEKGVSSIPQARRIVEIVGPERLVGAVLAVE